MDKSESVDAASGAADPFEHTKANAAALSEVTVTGAEPGIAEPAETEEAVEHQLTAEDAEKAAKTAEALQSEVIDLIRADKIDEASANLSTIWQLLPRDEALRTKITQALNNAHELIKYPDPHDKPKHEQAAVLLEELVAQLSQNAS